MINLLNFTALAVLKRMMYPFLKPAIGGVRVYVFFFLFLGDGGGEGAGAGAGAGADGEVKKRYILTPTRLRI